jgi:two-component system cell cycle response regulator DivK
MLGDPPAHPAKKVLIVEDTQPEALHNILEYHSYLLLATDRGEEAIEIAREHCPDLILMDVQLPEFTGMEAARRLKRMNTREAYPLSRSPPFAMSGDREMILGSGCDEYVAKPLNVLEFLELVERYTKSA